MFGKVYQIFLQKLEIGNRPDVNKWDLPDELLINRESLTDKGNIMENMKIQKQ